MQRLLQERRIRDTHARLVRARSELAVLDEQLATVDEGVEDLRVRSIVSETPMAARDYAEAARHASVMHRARVAMAVTVADLERRQDDLLASMGSGR
jgi:hypothetical protein